MVIHMHQRRYEESSMEAVYEEIVDSSSMSDSYSSPFDTTPPPHPILRPTVVCHDDDLLPKPILRPKWTRRVAFGKIIKLFT